MKQYSALDMQGNEIINCPSLDGAGGDASLLEDITSNVTVGAITQNQKIDKNTSFTEFAKKLLTKDVSPTVSFSASGSGLHEVGTSVNGTTMKLTISNLNSVNLPINTVEFKIGNTVVDAQPFVSGQSVYQFVSEDPITANTKASAVVTYSTNKTVTGSSDFTFVYASYYGAVESVNPTESEILALTKSIKNTKSFTWDSANLSNQRYCYAYPSSLGNLTSIKDSNNFEYIQSYTKSSLIVNGESYNVYVLTNPVTINNGKQIYI